VAARAGGTGSRGTGPVLLYHIGRGNSSRSFGNCSLCLGGRSPDPIGDCTDVPGFNPPIRISYADSWSAPASSWKEIPGDPWPGDENPSPWVSANGAHKQLLISTNIHVSRNMTRSIFTKTGSGQPQLETQCTDLVIVLADD